MDLSEWFRGQLQSSADAFIWAVEQVPQNRREIAPPSGFGEWNVARHIFHMLHYEREGALPHMQHWTDGTLDLTHTFHHYDEDRAWQNGVHSIDAMLREFQQVRAEQIALLPNFTEQLWQEVCPSGWGPKNMNWIVTKTLQHTADHTNTILQMALFWDYALRDQS
ncbi:MAG TPA: DinB family protein [Ktedonobacteraceae bacterium]|jgi:hypothetical protein